MASGHMSRTRRPNTWLLRPRLRRCKKVLANAEPSTHGTLCTCRAWKWRVCLGKGQQTRCRPLIAYQTVAAVDPDLTLTCSGMAITYLRKTLTLLATQGR